MGIGTVDAFEMASPFGLQIQHSAVLQVIFKVGRIGNEAPADLSFPGSREGFFTLAGDNTRQRPAIFPVLDGIQQ